MSDRDMQEIAKLFRDLKFKKKLFGAMKTCLYYNEDAGTIENTGIKIGRAHV